MTRLGVIMAGLAVTTALAAGSAAAGPRKRQPPPGMVEVEGRYFPDFAPLGPVPYPADNPPNRKKEQLGETLFFDKRLSRDGELSCSTCHDPKQDFTDDFPTARGRGGKRLLRRTRSLKNVAYNTSLFWDGRAPTLESQFFMVLRSPDEMKIEPGELVRRLNKIPAYRTRFHEVFGAEGISSRTVSLAVAAYQRTLRAGDSIFDEFLRGDTRSMVAAPLAGMKLFKGKARCIVCHNGPTLSDGKFHNTGLSPAAATEEDLGRQRVDGKAESRRAFRTPMLRNSSHNTPYFHDGSIGNIEIMLDMYNKGGHHKDGLDPDIRPLNLSRSEILQLKAFLYTMGETVYDRSRDKSEHRTTPEEEALYRQ